MMPPILIAECCQNHNGDREILKAMIHAAAEAGADYVKVQTMRSWELSRRPEFEEGEVAEDGTVLAIRRPYDSERERLSRLDLSLDDEAWFVEECRRAGVAPLTTIFTRAGVRDVKELGYPAVKVASYDCASYPLLRDLRRYWSRMFVSTGATFDREIAHAAALLDGVDLTLLHCVTIYPTPIEELHLRRMDWLRRFAPRVGFSDHTAPDVDGIWGTKLALAMGADCIERHFTVLGKGESKDGPVSISPDQLKELREFANRPRQERMEIIRSQYPGWEKTLGSARRDLSHVELLNRDYYRGRFASKVNGSEIFNWEEVVFPGDSSDPVLEYSSVG